MKKEYTFSDVSSLESLLGHKLTADLKGNAYIANDARNMAGYFYSSRNYLTTSAYKIQWVRKMEYCCHVEAASAESKFSNQDRLQK